MTDNASRAKDEELRIELLQTIFKFKKLANSGLGMKLVDGKQDISLAEFMLLRAIEENCDVRAVLRMWVPRTLDDFSLLLKVRCRK